MTETTSISLTFGNEDSESDQLDIFADPTNESSPTPGSTVSFFVIRSDRDSPYSVLSNADTYQKISTDVPYTITSEQVQFVNASKAQLNYVANSIISSSWSGRVVDEEGALITNVTPSFSGRAVSLGQKVTGVLSVNYTTVVDKWNLSLAAAGTAIVQAKQKTLTADLQIDFGDVNIDPIGTTLPTTDTFWDLCNIELRDSIGGTTFTVDTGDSITVRCYGFSPTAVSSTPLITVVHNTNSIYETFTEHITFTNGESEVDFPVFVSGSSRPTIVFDNTSISPTAATLEYQSWSKKLKISYFVHDPDYVSVGASVTYKTRYDLYVISVDSGFLSASAIVGFTGQAGTNCTATDLTLAITQPSPAAVPLTVNIGVVDYVTGLPLSGVTVTIGGAGAGVTNANGILTTPITPGTQTIKFEKTGYIASDVDSLDNDSITI